MDTLLILRDTITANVVKVTDSCSNCVQEAETNWADVQIAFLICLAIVIAIFIITVTGCICYVKKCKKEQIEKSLEINKEVFDKLTSIRKELQFNTLEVIKEQTKIGIETVNKYVGKADEYLWKYEPNTTVLNENKNNK